MHRPRACCNDKLGQLALLLITAGISEATSVPTQQQAVAAPSLQWWPWPPASDPLGNVQKLAEGLYSHNNLDVVDQYCVANVVVHGDGVWLPRAAFIGTRWIKAIHAEWFQAYTNWHFQFFELTASQAVKGFTEVFGFFLWQADNTGSYHGLSPTQRQSRAYGILHATTDKVGNVTDVVIWRAGFLEERDVLLKNASTIDVITPLRDITDQPFWVPSKSLQLKMMTRAHALLEVFNQGEKFLDSLDDMLLQSVVFIDGMDIWGPTKLVGVTGFKLWMASWMQQYDVNAAVTGTAATAYSNKVFLSFKMLLTDSSDGSAMSVEGCIMYVFNIQGFIAHMVIFRNGTPREAQLKFITGAPPKPGTMKPVQEAPASSMAAGAAASHGQGNTAVALALHQLHTPKQQPLQVVPVSDAKLASKTSSSLDAAASGARHLVVDGSRGHNCSKRAWRCWEWWHGWWLASRPTSCVSHL